MRRIPDPRPVPARPTVAAGLILTAALAFLAPAAAGAAGLPAELLAAAKKEGTVVIYTGGHTREQITELAKRFEQEHGIKVQATRKPTGDILQMLAAEQKAGAVRADVIAVADLAALDYLRNEGLLDKYLPPNAGEVVESLVAPGGDSVPFTLNVLGIAYNKAKVPADKAPKAWRDLADPFFSGKVAHGNPATSGTTAGFVNAVTRIVGWDLYRTLGAGGMLVQDSATALAQLVVTGEALVALPGVEPQVLDAQKRGEPLAMAYPVEGVPVNAYYVSVAKGAKNPSAARLFVAYHVADETQRFLNDRLASRSVLKHVAPPTGLPKVSEVNVVTPDFAWLAKNRKQMLEQFTGYLKK